MSEWPNSFIETLSNSQIVTLRDLFQFRIDHVTWDFDEILSDTQTPVKKEFLLRTGGKFDFRNRKIDRWLALAHWSVDFDKSISFNEIAKVEADVWSDKDVLVRALPNVPMQVYSRLAYENKVAQSVITTRIPDLNDVTFAWLEKHYPWIDKKDIHIRLKKESQGGLNGDVFKGVTARNIGSKIHVDDSVNSVAEVINLSDASALLFPRSMEMGKFVNSNRVIEFPDMQLWMRLFGLHQDY